MEKKKSYKCGLCGKEYETIAERAKCESACIDNQLAIEENAKKEKAKQEQEARRQELVAAIKHAGALLDAYTNDYGTFSYDSTEEVKEEVTETPAVKPTEKTVSKSENILDGAWHFNNWPFTSKWLHYFW